MKKLTLWRFSTILAAVFCLVLCLAVLTACGSNTETPGGTAETPGDSTEQGGNGDSGENGGEGGETTPTPHIHTFVNEWTGDETQHWRVATCGHTTEVADKGEHVYNAENVCTVCLGKKPTVGLEYSSDSASYCYVTGLGTATDTDIVIPAYHTGCPWPVKSINNEAFRDCSSLTSVTIPNSVTSIGAFAFYGCTGLASVTIGNGVTSIGEKAFNGCTNLTYNTYDNAKYLGNAQNLYMVLLEALDTGITSCTIHENTKVIGGSAFSDCRGLRDITIPDSITHINGNAFYYYLSLSVYITNLDAWCGIDFASGLCKSNILFLDDTPVRDLVIPSGVTNIGDHAFSGFVFASITIPNSVTSIGESAFEECTYLTSITIPDSVTSIGERAFKECTGLTSVTIGNGVTSIGYYAFYSCGKLIEVYNRSSLSIIKDSDDHGGVASKVLNVYTPTSGASKLDMTTYPGYIFYIDGDTRYLVGYTGFERVLTLPANYNEQSYAIYKNAFYGCSVTSITIPDSVTSIGERAFKECTGLTSIIIPDSVTSIGGYAFDTCVSLTYNTYDNAKYLGNAQNPYLVLIEALNTHITSCTIHENAKVICDDAFFGCTSLVSITIPDSVTSIGRDVFGGCMSLASITFADTSTWCCTTSSTDWSNQTGGTVTDVTDPNTNAIYFKNTYNYSYWYKK